MQKDPYVRWLDGDVWYEVREQAGQLTIYEGTRSNFQLRRTISPGTVVKVTRHHQPNMDCIIQAELTSGEIFTIRALRSVCQVVGMKLRRFGTVTCQLAEVGTTHSLASSDYLANQSEKGPSSN